MTSFATLMRMPIRTLSALLGAPLLASLLLAGCGGGGGGGGSMFLEACSLGCSNGASNSQVFCSSDTIRQNQEIVLVFSEPVDIASVGPATFQVIDVVSGANPSGSYLVDPVNPKRLIFRPSIIVTPAGQLEFGFQQGETYRVVVPGSDLDPGPYIKSIDGAVNKNRVLCDIQPSGIVDVVPGAPTVQVFVDQQLFDGSGNPAGIQANVPANGAVDVSQNSTIRIVFNDVMNPLTLITAGTQESPTVQVLVDRDGDPSTSADETPLAGSFSANIDQVSSTTRLTFRPVCIPSAGIDERKIVIKFAPGIADLVGNPLANSNNVAFTPEVSDGNALILPEPFGESFATRVNLDEEASGAEMWAPSAQPGRLVPGFGGGSGRHGTLVVEAGQTVTLDTDTQVFPAPTFPFPGIEHDQITNEVPGLDYDPLDRSTWPLLPVVDGVFEFGMVRVAPGGVLRLNGDAHARLFSRGDASVSGTIDVSGESPPAHSTADATSTGGLGGPNGADGGAGGTRFDAPVNLRNLTPGPSGIDLAAGVQNLDGLDGGDVGLGATGGGVPPPEFTNGVGAPHVPTNFPSSAQPAGFGGLLLNDASCMSEQIAAPGSGAGYALAGGNGVPMLPAGVPVAGNLPPQTPGGQATPIEPAEPESGHFVRRLSADLGFLRGGGGGGGGGTHPFGTATEGIPGFNCSDAAINKYFDNSGAPGGGGGGALQLATGGDLRLIGRILANGGNGSSAITTAPADTGGFDRRNTAPGGGGSGGAVRLQGLSVQISAQAGRIDVRGGAGGLGIAGSTGGAGSRGLVRLESTDPSFPISRDSEASKVAPYDANDPTDSYEHLSVGPWTSPRRRPEAFSGASSCWFKATLADCFLQLTFEEDVPGSDDPDDMGWNMDVIYDSGSGEQVFPYRGIPDDPNFPLLQSLQDALGNHLAEDASDPLGSRFVVRFQGAQSRDDVLSDPCDVQLSGVDADVIGNSVTPWVSHPAQLNQFVPAPNMIRFVVIFDGTLAVPNTLGSFVKGVTNLRIHATPD